MGKLAIVDGLTRSFHKAGFKLKKHSPEILITAGVIGTVASTVMACKATLKVDEIKKDTEAKIEKIHTAVETGVTEAGQEYTLEDSKKDLTIVYTQTGLKLAKLYAPAVILGVLSVTSIVTSHKILRTRNVALAAAYASVDKSFKEYRGRVIDRFGAELDRELKYDVKTKEIEETVMNEDGTESVVKKTVEVVDDPNNVSPYARFFDDGCKGWEKDAEQNLFTLKTVQNYANDKLKAEGRLFLNDVYEMLGIPKTKAGQVVGWVYDELDPIGDNFIDFGIYDCHRTSARDFVNGYERSILLDFNVDGNVWELMQ